MEFGGMKPHSIKHLLLRTPYKSGIFTSHNPDHFLLRGEPGHIFHPVFKIQRPEIHPVEIDQIKPVSLSFSVYKGVSGGVVQKFNFLLVKLVAKTSKGSKHLLPVREISIQDHTPKGKLTVQMFTDIIRPLEDQSGFLLGISNGIRRAYSFGKQNLSILKGTLGFGFSQKPIRNFIYGIRDFKGLNIDRFPLQFKKFNLISVSLPKEDSF